MNYRCPKCGGVMQALSTASIPAITRYECWSCGYSSKPIKEDVFLADLPEEWMEDAELSEEKHE